MEIIMKTIANRDIPTFAMRGLDADGYGALRTRSTPQGILKGGYRTGYLPRRLQDRMRERGDSIVQVIYSYGTPIAWLDAGAWVVPDVRYSVTTGRHQGQLWPLPGRVSIPADCGPLGYARILNGLDIYDRHTGKLTSPHATR